MFHKNKLYHLKCTGSYATFLHFYFTTSVFSFLYVRVTALGETGLLLFAHNLKLSHAFPEL